MKSRKYTEARRKLEEFINSQVTANGHKVLRIRADGEGCFKSKRFERWARKSGIVVETTTRATSQANGRAEAAIKVAARRTRCALLESGMSKKWWPYARRHASYVSQRTFTSANVSGRSPLEEMTGKTPECGHLRAFGAPLLYYVTDGERRRLDARAKPGRLVGYSDSQAAYWVLCDESNTIKSVR